MKQRFLDCSKCRTIKSIKATTEVVGHEAVVKLHKCTNCQTKPVNLNI